MIRWVLVYLIKIDSQDNQKWFHKEVYKKTHFLKKLDFKSQLSFSEMPANYFFNNNLIVILTCYNQNIKCKTFYNRIVRDILLKCSFILKKSC
jgi:hypothetical protein